MNKINGYTEEEAKSLVQYVCERKSAGMNLSGIFADYAKKTGRAKGSVRNYYYALLRSGGDNRVKSLLTGTGLKAEKIIQFTEEETDEILKAILLQKSKGISVRKAVLTLSNGDDKLMLRYQNKYRNVLAKQPERIERLMRECGIESGTDAARKKIEAIAPRTSGATVGLIVGITVGCLTVVTAIVVTVIVWKKKKRGVEQ